MKCRFCGSRIGILERWRFGDFCSKEHKDEFAGDLVRLNEQIVQDLRHLPPVYKAAETEAEPAPSEPAVVEMPDPPEAEFVLESDPEPLVEIPQPKVAEEPPPQRSKSDQWRLFSKIADWEGLPAGALTAGKEEEKGDRFLWVQLSDEPQQGPQGALLAASFPAILPRQVLGRLQGHMPMSPVWVPPDPRQRAAEDAQRYAMGGAIEQCVEEHAWGWMADAAASEVPDLAPVLTDYPLTAPWTNWTILPPRPQVAPPQPPAMPMQPTPPAARPMQSMPPSGIPMQAPRPSGIPMPQQVAPAMPASPPPPPPVAGMPVIAGHPAGHSAVIAPVPAGQLTVAPPGAVTAWPTATPALVPLGLGTPSVVPGAPAQGYAYAAPLIMNSGLTWRELPPPLFSALVDLGELVKPLALPFVQLVPEYSSVRPTILIAGNQPRFLATLSSGMPFVDCQGDPSEDMIPMAPHKFRLRSHARTLWRRILVLPKAYGDVGQPQVPHVPAPAFVFALKNSLPAPVARPQLQIGRWQG